MIECTFTPKINNNLNNNLNNQNIQSFIQRINLIQYETANKISNLIIKEDYLLDKQCPFKPNLSSSISPNRKENRMSFNQRLKL